MSHLQNCLHGERLRNGGFHEDYFWKLVVILLLVVLYLSSPNPKYMSSSCTAHYYCPTCAFVRKFNKGDVKLRLVKVFHPLAEHSVSRSNI